MFVNNIGCFRLVLIVVLSLLSPARSADIDLPGFDLRLSGDGEAKPISLHGAIAIALQCNLDLQIDSIAPQIESDRTLAATGEFDPSFETRFRYDTLNTPQTSQEFISTGGNRFLNGNLIAQNRIFEEDNFEAKSGIVGKLRSGTQYDIGVRGNRFTNDLTRDKTVAIFSPEYRSFTGVTLLQPLMRDFGRDVNESQIKVSLKDKAIADQVFRQNLATAVKGVIDAYYDGYLAMEDARVKRQEVTVLRRMLEEKADQLERGAATERDIAELRSAISESYERFLLARQTLLARNGDLLLILQQDFDFDHYPVYLPTDAPSGLRPTLEPCLLVKQAIRCRPEYLMAVEAVEKLGIVLQYRENQLMPRVDLEGTIGYSGLAGNFGDAFSNTTEGQGNEYGVGIVVSVPLGNTEKKALYAETGHQKRQAILNVKQEELKAHILINQHISAVQTHEKRLMAARLSTRLEMENLERSRESLEKGTLTESMVLKAESDVSETALRQSAASADLQKSLADLWETNGTLLSRYGIEVSPATHLEPAVITSHQERVSTATVIASSDDYGRPPQKVKIASEENPLESAFNSLFTRTGKAGAPAEISSIGKTRLIASPLAEPEETTPTDDMVESPAPVQASPVKSKLFQNLFEKR